MQLTPEQQDEKERQDIELVATVSNVDSQVAHRVYRKYKGDIERAIGAIIDGDRATDGPAEPKHHTTPEPIYDSMQISTPTNPSTTPVPSSSVIDLTISDDQEIQRALQMSLETSSQPTAHFQRSDRAPHAEWQMVRSNDPIGTLNHEEQTLKDAIQASLQDITSESDVLPFKESLREGGRRVLIDSRDFRAFNDRSRPIAVRPTTPGLAYAALIVQALYAIPQVRAVVANLRLPSIDPHTHPEDPRRFMWNLIELFTNLDLAQLSAIVDNELLPSLRVEPIDDGSTTMLIEYSEHIVKEIAHLVEQHIQTQSDSLEPEHFFFFSHGRITLVQGYPQKVNRSPDPGTIVPIQYGEGEPYNDLISCLSNMLTSESGTSSTHDVIISPSDIVVFSLRRIQSTGVSRHSPDPFIYPKTMFFDRFLFENLEFTNTRRVEEKKLNQEICNLLEYKRTLCLNGGRDTLQDLRSAIHYYEEVADRGDVERQQSLDRTLNHLNDIMTVIQGKIEGIEHRIEQLQDEMSRVYDCPELQHLQYDLRAVLVHTGLPGRNHIYSYVQDLDGVWWKTVDHIVTEVAEETVLTDPTGIHLGAGPHMLFYSRHLTDQALHEPVDWPVIFAETVMENNRKFLAMIPELEVLSKPTESGEAGRTRRRQSMTDGGKQIDSGQGSQMAHSL